MSNHAWEDMARHGSPEWECHYCGVSKTKDNREEFCQKHADYLEAKRIDLEEKEKQEHAHIVYLLRKYGAA